MSVTKKGLKPSSSSAVEGAEGVLNLTVHQAKDFVEKPGNIYCVVTSSFNKQRFKTKVIKKSKDPTWDHDFVFFVTDIADHSLYFRVWSKDRWGRDENLGEVSVPLKSFEDGDKKDTWYDLETKKKEKKGKLFVTIHFPVNKKQVQEKEEKQPKEKEVKEEKPFKNTKTINEVYVFGDELGRGGFFGCKESHQQRIK